MVLRTIMFGLAAALAVATIIGCGDVTPIDCADSPCGEGPSPSGVCDDGDPCTRDEIAGDVCEHAPQEDGHSCTTPDATLGVCVSGVCSTNTEPSTECTGKPNKWSCNYPYQGTCLDGVCVPGE